MEKTNIIDIENFKHSASSVNTFIQNPSKWLCSYGLKLKEPSNPAMTRGKLAEFGAYYKIKRGMQQKDDTAFAKLIKWQFKRDKFLNAAGEVENAIAIAKEFEKLLYERQFRTIISYQKHIVQNVNGLNFPINLYNDFEFENMIVDTKSTLRCPSAPYPKDLRQVSIYSKLIGKPVTLLYATPKKHLWYELTAEEVDKYYEEVCINFKQLENYIMTCNNSLEQAIRITPLDTTPRPFKWDDNIKQEAEKIWKKVNKQL